MSTQLMYEEFKNKFNPVHSPRQFFAPGRINLIGEHTDYNGGHVFPASISFGTYALATKRSDNKIRFYSMNFSDLGIIEVNLDNLDYNEDDNWAKDRKSTRLNSSHVAISYAVFGFKKKINNTY